MAAGPQVGDRFWLILPDMESESYGDYNAREPWLSQVVSTDRDILHLGRVGTIIPLDTDSNASTFVDFHLHPEHLHPTEGEARAAYDAWMARQPPSYDEVVAALPPPMQIRLLIDWLGTIDEDNMQGLANWPSMSLTRPVWDISYVQDDLRAWADRIEAVQARLGNAERTTQ